MILQDLGITNQTLYARYLLPLIMDSNNLLRVGRASANLPLHTLSWLEFYDNTVVERYNQAGRYYFQPSLTAPSGAFSNDEHYYQTVPVSIAASAHYSPHKDYLPTLVRDANGDYYTAYGERSGDGFRPFLNRANASKQPYHDTEINLYNTTMSHSNSGITQVSFENSSCRYKRVSMAVNAWMLCMINSTGNFEPTITTTLSDNFVFAAYCGSNPSALNSDTLYSTGETSYMLKSPDNKSQYCLIKSNTVSIGYNSAWPYGGDILSPYIIEQPWFRVTLPKQCSMQVTSYGFDMWPLVKFI